MFQAFAKNEEHQLGEPVWEVMKMMGTDLVSYVVKDLRSNQVVKMRKSGNCDGDQPMKVAFCSPYGSSD